MTLVSLSHRPVVIGQLFLRGVQNQEATQIKREPNGLIHVIADNDQDLFFAQGVVMAQVTNS